MDLLKAEIARKKSGLSAPVAGKKRSWVKASDRAAELLAETERAATAKRAKSSPAGDSPRGKASARASSAVDVKLEARAAVLKTMSKNEIQRRLRDFGQPVTLFGEASDDRIRRLARLETDGSSQAVNDGTRLTGAYAIRNSALAERHDPGGGAADPAGRSGAPTATPRDDDFDDEDSEDEDEDGKACEAVSSAQAAQDGRGAQVAAKSPAAGKPQGTATKKAPSAFKLIRTFVRSNLKLWEQELEEREDSAKSCAQGRVATKTFKQCKDYVRPLLKLCKLKYLDEGICKSMVKMIHFCEQGEFVLANNEYILVAIGNAAWPIGVTSVGIHTRTARENVEQKNVAHVMNNELQRKYLTSMKRLMKFNQDHCPDVAPSKKVM